MPLSPEAEQAIAPKPRRTWRRRAVVLFVLTLVATSGGLIYRHYTDAERIRAIAEAYLQKHLRELGKVTIGSARFSWLEGIRLRDVRVTEASPAAGPPGDHASNVVFSCPQAQITLDPLSILVGKLNIRSIVATEPTCSIVRNSVDGTTNVAALLRELSLADRRPGSVSLPTIELTRARVRVVTRDRGLDRIVEELVLTLRGRHLADDNRFYDVVWQVAGEFAGKGHSQIDLESGTIHNVDGGLPWMSIEAVMIAINARYEQAGTLLDLLGLHGTVRAVDYNLGNGTGEGGARSATIDLKNAFLSIPIDERERSLSPHQRYLRFSEVYGTIRLTAADVHYAEFTALFHGSRCHVTAEIRGGVDRLLTLGDLDFGVSLSIKRLEFPQMDPDRRPDEYRFINHWPKLIRFYNDFDPTGLVDLELTAHKEAGADKPIVVERALLTTRGGSASCRWFPYRVHGLNGEVEFTQSGVFLRGLSGNHGEGVVRVDGEFAAPNRCAPGELHITGAAITIDQDLYDGCGEQYEKIADLLDPQGTLDVDLLLVRPPCQDGKPGEWRAQCTVSFDNLSAKYAGFPYQVEQLAGKLILDGEHLEVVNVRGRAGEATVDVEGTLTLGAGGIESLDLRVRGEDVAFDDRLSAAMPPDIEKLTAAFHPAGRFAFQTTLRSNSATGATTQASSITLHGVTIRHEAFPVTVTNLQGTIDFDAQRAVVGEITGRYREADVSVRGYIHYLDSPGGMELSISCQDLQIDEDLKAALPAKIGEVLATWQVDGPIDSTTVLRSDQIGSTDSLSVETVAQLKGVTVRHSLFPLPFEGVFGEITFDKAGSRARGIEARYGPARIQLDFDTRTTPDGEAGTISLTATGLVLDRAVRDLLPERLRASWAELEPAGVVDLRLMPLRYHPSSRDKSRVWSIDAQLELHDVALGKLLDIAAMNGTLAAEGFLRDRLGGTTLTGVLNLSTLDLLSRRLTDLEGSWSYLHTANGAGRFVIAPIRGLIYEGQLTAEVELMLAEPRPSGSGAATYAVSTTVSGMQIDQFVNAGRSPLVESAEPVQARGLADVHMDVYGTVGNPSSRQGRGRVEVRQGHMYRLPIILEILNFLKLSIPEQDAFSEAEADFFIIGDRAELKNILLRGSVLALAGHGTMSLPDRGVDLHLAYSNPRGWPAVPILDDLIKELVELHVTGPLSQPTVKPRPFGGLQDEFRRLFRKREPKRIQAEEP